MKALWIALGALTIGGGGYLAYQKWGKQKTAAKPSAADSGVTDTTTVAVGPTAPTQTGVTPGGLPTYDVGLIPPDTGIDTDKLVLEEPDKAMVYSSSLRGLRGFAGGIRIV